MIVGRVQRHFLHLELPELPARGTTAGHALGVHDARFHAVFAGSGLRNLSADEESPVLARLARYRLAEQGRVRQGRR